MKFKCLLCGNDRSLTFEPDLEYEGRILPSGAVEVEPPPEELIVAIIKAQHPGGLLCGVCRNHVYVYNEEEDLMAGLRCSDCGENNFICRANVEMEGHITEAGNLEVPDMTKSQIVTSINALLEGDDPIMLECSSCNTMKQYQVSKPKGGNSAAILQEV